MSALADLSIEPSLASTVRAALESAGVPALVELAWHEWPRPAPLRIGPERQGAYRLLGSVADNGCVRLRNPFFRTVETPTGELKVHYPQRGKLCGVLDTYVGGNTQRWPMFFLSPTT